MSKHYPLDPEDEESMQAVEQALSAALSPIPLDPGRQDPLRARLMARVARAQQAGEGFIRVPLAAAEWRRLLPGVRMHRLAGAQRAVIIELAAGSPGTIAMMPSRWATADARSSKRRSACRASSSGP